MKSKGANENETGMLEYLEDIIGTGRYKVGLWGRCWFLFCVFFFRNR